MKFYIQKEFLNNQSSPTSSSEEEKTAFNTLITSKIRKKGIASSNKNPKIPNIMLKLETINIMMIIEKI